MAPLAIKFNSRSYFGIQSSNGFKYANIKKGIKVFLIVFVVLVARQLSMITWQLLPSASRYGSSVFATHSSRASGSGSVDMWSQLKNLHLFGMPPKPEVVEIEPVNVPVSRMAAKITGLVASSNREHSFVILKRGSTSETYRIGEQLKGSRFRIESIEYDRVIIRDGSKLESLLMYPDEKSNKNISNEHNMKNATISSEPMSQIQKILSQTPASISDVISIYPVKKDGILYGYRISPGKNPVFFDQFGLRSNDIAVALNGYDLTINTEAMKVFSLLPTLKKASLTIVRDGQRLDIDLSS